MFTNKRFSLFAVILLVTANRHPERYIEGGTLKLSGEVWTFTDRESAAWYPDHKDGVTDWTMRLKQLVGVPQTETIPM